MRLIDGKAKHSPTSNVQRNWDTKMSGARAGALTPEPQGAGVGGEGEERAARGALRLYGPRPGVGRGRLTPSTRGGGFEDG